MTTADPSVVFDDLFAAFGPQHWWPAQTDFEIMAGAVLTQNTAWRNVERALARLRADGLLAPDPLLRLDEGSLAERIRPAGSYNVKAQRLRNLTAALQADGGVAAWAERPTGALRDRLLGIKGVGEETADCILLYVFGRAVFPVDAYTRRIFTRLGILRGREPYGAIAAGVYTALPVRPDVYNELHALIVRLGSERCRPRPRCHGCPLQARCPVGRAAADAANSDVDHGTRR